MIKKIKTFWSMLYSANWYQGIDKPNFYQKYYKWRLGIKTSWEVAKIIHR